MTRAAHMLAETKDKRFVPCSTFFFSTVTSAPKHLEHG